MIKITKMGIAILLSLFLVACDKPAMVNTNEQGIVDFQKIMEWKQTQEQVLAASHIELEKKLATQDDAQIKEGFKLFADDIRGILNSLDSLDIKHGEVAIFKEKTKDSLSVLNEVFDAMVNRAPDIAEKKDKLIQIGSDVQKIQSELQAKFGTK